MNLLFYVVLLLTFSRTSTVLAYSTMSALAMPTASSLVLASRWASTPIAFTPVAPLASSTFSVLSHPHEVFILIVACFRSLLTTKWRLTSNKKFGHVVSDYIAPIELLADDVKLGGVAANGAAAKL